jgi:hypothetical protein
MRRLATMRRLVTMKRLATMNTLAIMNKLTVLLLTLTLLAFQAGPVLAEGTTIDYSGSLETSGIAQSINNDFFLGAGTLTEYPTLGSRIKWQNDFRIVANEQTTLRFRVSYFNDTTQTIVPNNQFTFSRGFIDFTPNELLSLRAGKQRLAWGTGYAWNPVNILDEPRNAFTDTDDPEGVMAFRTDLNFGPVTGQVVITPEDSWDSSGRALRLKASSGGVDLSLGVVQNGTQTAATIGDFACSLAGVGLHGEVRYQSDGNSRADKNDIFDYLIGIDYNLPGGYYVAVEYYHNDQAYKNITELQAYIMTQMTDPAVIMNYLNQLGNNGGVMQDHLFLRGSKNFGENMNLELMLIYCPTDHSLVGQPKFQYVWGQNTSLFVKGLIASGDLNTEANIMPTKNCWTLGVKVNF